MKVALVTASPHRRSPVGDATRALLPYLRQHCEVVEFVDDAGVSAHAAAHPMRACATLRAREFDHVVYALGNEASHAFMVPLVRTIGGTVLQHDWRLPRLAAALRPALSRGGARGALAALLEGGVDEARAYVALQHVAPSSLEGLAVNRSVVRSGDAYLVFSARMKRLILESRNSATPVGVVAAGIEPRWRDEVQRASRPSLGLPSGWSDHHLAVASAHGASAHALDVLLAAFADVRASAANARLAILAGDSVALDTRVSELALGDAVHVAHAADADRFAWLHAADVLIDLDATASAGVRAALAAGRGVIALGARESMQARAVIEVGDRGTLTSAWTAIVRDPAHQRALELAARAFIADDGSCARAAAEIAACLAVFPPPRSCRKSLIQAAVLASRSAGAADDHAAR